VTADRAFAEIRGQEEAVDLLCRAVAGGRVAHAYAFVGPPGSGRKQTALAFATALAAPGDAAAAARIRRGVHPDVRLFEPTPPEKNPKGPLALRIGDIRELERLAALRPAQAPWKVFIVDGAERMTADTPQAFLKTLEEPPASTVIVLILTRLRALPATVLSRCQIVRFRPRQPEGTLALLPDGRSEVYRPGLAALEAAAREGAPAILRAAETVGRDRAAAESLVQGCWLRYRDLLCRAAGADAGLAVFGSTAEEPARSLADIQRGLAACREAWYAIQGNVSPRLSVEVLLGRLTREEALG
jgi:DNA polymerase-3 subunit delta'